MVFIKDSEQREQKLDFKLVNDKQMDILLINFNNVLGTGNTEPLDMATINHRKVYLNFIINALASSDIKKIHYTWYLREEVAHV